MDSDEGNRARQPGRPGAGGPPSSSGKDAPVGDSPRVAAKIRDLLQKGHELAEVGRFHQAIHIWERILFLDRGNRTAREWIDKAKRAVAEQEREFDAQVLQASRLLEGGDRHGARLLVAGVLDRDPRHPEARSLWERLEILERRGDRPSRSLSVSGGRVPVRSRRQRTAPLARPDAGRPRPVSALKVAAFLFSALCLFGAGALYLHLNWDFLVSEGPFGSARESGAGTVDPIEIPPVPFPAELHYYSGYRLFAKGKYREALVELARVERQSPAFESARSLTLRIEERLLRGALGGETAPPGDRRKDR
jgi:tetratricopeptide (TPR) repeat protein